MGKYTLMVVVIALIISIGFNVRSYNTIVDIERSNINDSNQRLDNHVVTLSNAIGRYERASSDNDNTQDDLYLVHRLRSDLSESVSFYIASGAHIGESNGFSLYSRYLMNLDSYVSRKVDGTITTEDEEMLKKTVDDISVINEWLNNRDYDEIKYYSTKDFEEEIMDKLNYKPIHIQESK